MECPICYEFDDQPVTITSCQHSFHTVCLKVWLNKQDTCPYCRCKNPCMSRIIHASETNNLSTVKRLLNDGMNVDETDTYGNTALIYASYKGSRTVIPKWSVYYKQINVVFFTSLCCNCFSFL